MLLRDVGVESVRDLVEVVLAHPADEAVRFHVLLDALELVAELAERVDDQT